MPITRQLVKIAQYAWGTSRPYLQGKSTRHRNGVVEVNIESIIPIPPKILDNHKDITMCMDIMFINGIPFLTTISRTVGFNTATEM